MDFSLLYDIIYSLAARDGRVDTLFGKSAPLAHEAFVHSSPCDTFPELWFELPLLGDPWFDLHVLTHRDSLSSDMTFVDETTGGYSTAFEWFSHQSDVRQLALSWDVGSRGATSPAIQLLMKRSNLAESSAFFEVVGRAEAIEGYETFVRRLPRGWFACYAGTFPDRSDAPVRVECIPGPSQQQAYARAAGMLRHDLRMVGMDEPGDTLVSQCQELARTPYQFELQFNVTDDGRADDTVSASVRFMPPTSSDREKSFDPQGGTKALVQQIKSWGLADERLDVLRDVTFSKRASLGNESFLLYCFPAFIKVRWRDGNPIDAKAYLMAGAQ